MTECNRCGDCCRVILLCMSKKRLAATRNDDVPFLLKHWHRISLNEARRRNPMVRRDLGYLFYQCDAFDPDKNECTVHESRPQVCRGYPWYGTPPFGDKPNLDPISIFPRCSFWADVPATQRPVYVQMGETRRAS